MSRRHRSQVLHMEDNETAENEEVSDYVNKCVRYIIYRSSSNELIKKKELKKNVLPDVGRSFDDIMKKVTAVLDVTYGFKLVACEDGYITVQNIDNNIIEIENSKEDEIPGDIRKVLIMLVLTNIFMSATPVNEASLCLFLNTTGMNTDNDKGIFGRIMDFIKITMVKQNYIVLQSDPLSREIIYKWGARAENTISKQKILEFVSTIYGDRQPSSWVSQYEEAQQQFDVGRHEEVTLIE